MTPKTRLFARTVSALFLWLCAAPAIAAGFASPSGNIRCYLDVYSDLPFGDMPMICLIFDADWDLPPDYGDSDPTCDLDRTRTLILQPTGRPQERWTCHGDVFWPEPLGTLSYGSEWSMLGYGCRVETRGVTCTNGDKTFFVSRATRSFF